MESQGVPADAHHDAERQTDGDGREVCCSMTNVLVRLVRRHGGEQAVAELWSWPA